MDDVKREIADGIIKILTEEYGIQTFTYHVGGDSYTYPLSRDITYVANEHGVAILSLWVDDEHYIMLGDRKVAFVGDPSCMDKVLKIVNKIVEENKDRTKVNDSLAEWIAP